ncbi:hypothetical protein DMC61_14480 [Amycolatopsis sp. WAC 04169]|uniref:hypothetical protein n=1 Tax=Amycolatopsis sp. WAC 04169 TaxID=2203197 RepID=UPI000F783595|nr:hypothetical protein [Amycolatopsis sp. WAC 04169]RSN31352.1 hypothetical protein DMC61_14480 [Amycolatopsis sp. WAC 04169]
MTMGRDNRDALVLQARAALVMAALRRSIVTYKELGLAIGLKDIELRNEMPRVLEQLANDCHNAKEPPMTALVVNSQSGAPGAGWHGNGEPWHTDVQRVFRHWANRS